ncbi:MAG: IS4 family transposase [Leptolyngbya sp. UWPOB_LEPTO1]|uniref:IS4 family transposase n=2 Tax=Leptolyngbya group TaxID=3081713 RepID=UPI001AC8EB43|nr:IS4 family transposase [Leptolyngbya sp. UWPOB_LEPTO1]MBN8565090.1 IS4 family transposase [Leptolyngbya sp. UWPOB_LEPTO1]
MSISEHNKEQSWSEWEFAQVNLGDQRLNTRLRKLAADLSATPEAPINQASEDWAATKAAYRFFQNEKVISEQILNSHQARTVERMKQEAVVLAIQDTSYLNFSTHKQTQGLGPIGDRRSASLGLVTHNILAVTPQGLPLGLLHQIGWARAGYNQQSERERKNTSIEHKESYRWVQGLKFVQSFKPENTRVITLCDGESDIYELFVAAERCHSEFVIRAAWNRHLKDSEFPRLWEQLQAQPVAGCYQITVPSSGSKPERTTTLAVRFGTVTLAPTQRPKQSLFYPLPPVMLDAVYVTEVDAPNAEDQIEWMLLTNIAVNSFEQALEKVEWYCCRWQIEVFHKILQHGCQVEQCRLQSAERLNRYITLMSIVAWRLFWMTWMQRTAPTASARTILTELEIQTLMLLTHHSSDAQLSDFRVAQAVIAIAKLGGFLARKSDGDPGPTVIWRGWSVLQNATRFASHLFPQTCG